MKKIKGVFIFWVIIMFLITFTCSLVFLVAQQSLRIGVNEAPMQLAVETSLKLQKDPSINNAITTEKVDGLKSLNTFVIVYDKNKNLIATSAINASSELSYPKSVLNNVQQNNESRITWQPQSGLRFATVAIKYNNGYIVAARSLYETEKLIGIIGKLVLVAWLSCTAFSVFALGVIYIFMNKVYKNRKL